MEESIYWEDLPNGWRKRVVRRKNDPNKWDIAIFTPDKIRIRSRVGLMRYIQEKRIFVDPQFVNFEQPFDDEDSLKKSHNKMKFVKEIETLQKSLKYMKNTTPPSKESSPVPEETVNLSASMEVDKSVGIMLSSKQCIYLKRQFRKLKDMSQSHSEFLAKELKCPQDYISECFSLYKDYIKCQTETNSLLKSSNKDPLEFNEDELMKELEKDYEDFEVLNFEDETVRDHLVVVD
ncbi:unnamed protein product [Lepeophtheirus salmonis]|uniref:(salmon louse) hypothetical protein n=1 Tax=Lepeophtheirus salmonis TaxID=72036 RepID=A0A0K2TUL7_LEPSM|nr:unnamed protein product [Lepeophtheirus salmonis]CAF3017259.1 unnamed protein product [Lepeophtheirus salmonis]